MKRARTKTNVIVRKQDRMLISGPDCIDPPGTIVLTGTFVLLSDR